MHAFDRAVESRKSPVVRCSFKCPVNSPSTFAVQKEFLGRVPQSARNLGIDHPSNTFSERRELTRIEFEFDGLGSVVIIGLLRLLLVIEMLAQT